MGMGRYGNGNIGEHGNGNIGEHGNGIDSLILGPMY